jgi:hypothetical protein
MRQHVERIRYADELQREMPQDGDKDSEAKRPPQANDAAAG